MWPLVPRVNAVYKCWAVTTVTDTNVCRQFTIYVSVSHTRPLLKLTPAPEGDMAIISIGSWRDGGPCTGAISWAVRGPVGSPGLESQPQRLSCVALGWSHHFSEPQFCSMAITEPAQDWKLQWDHGVCWGERITTLRNEELPKLTGQKTKAPCHPCFWPPQTSQWRAQKWAKWVVAQPY